MVNHPQLHSVAATDAPNTFMVVLRSESGPAITWQATVDEREGAPPVVAFDPGPDAGSPWGGDAESVRTIVAAVLAVHRARHFGGD